MASPNRWMAEMMIEILKEQLRKEIRIEFLDELAETRRQLFESRVRIQELEERLFVAEQNSAIQSSDLSGHDINHLDQADIEVQEQPPAKRPRIWEDTSSGTGQRQMHDSHLRAVATQRAESPVHADPNHNSRVIVRSTTSSPSPSSGSEYEPPAKRSRIRYDRSIAPSSPASSRDGSYQADIEVNTANGKDSSPPCVKKPTATLASLSQEPLAVQSLASLKVCFVSQFSEMGLFLEFSDLSESVQDALSHSARSWAPNWLSVRTKNRTGACTNCRNPCAMHLTEENVACRTCAWGAKFCVRTYRGNGAIHAVLYPRCSIDRGEATPDDIEYWQGPDEGRKPPSFGKGGRGSQYETEGRRLQRLV